MNSFRELTELLYTKDQAVAPVWVNLKHVTHMRRVINHPDLKPHTMLWLTIDFKQDHFGSEQFIRVVEAPEDIFRS